MEPIATDRPLPRLVSSFSHAQGVLWIEEVRNLIRKKEKITKVMDRAIEIIDLIHSTDVKPHTTCKRGCSYCCHVPVGLTECEALYIQAKTGKTANLKNEKILTVETLKGAPCTFLKNGECSIYEFRPITCRVFSSFEDPEIYCNEASTLHYMFALESPTVKSTMINWVAFTALVGLGKREKRTRIKDIRQFFPA